MRIVVFGGTGLLGGYLNPELLDAGHEPVPLSRRTTPPVDVSRSLEVRRALDRERPAAVIFAAAMTDVEGCEADPERAWRVNARAADHAALWCSDAGIPLIYVSSDAVFNGRRGHYAEEDDTDPVNAYAISKFIGERYVLARGATVIRTNFLGAGEGSLLGYLHAELAADKVIHGYADACFTPLYAGDVARALRLLVEAPVEGLLHLGGPTRVSKLQVAMKVRELVRSGTVLEATMPQDPVRRPCDTSLDSSRVQELLQMTPTDWDQAISRGIADIERASHA